MALDMTRYACTVCSYGYHPLKGDPENGILPGRPFAGLPDDLKTVFMELFEEYLNQQSLEARIVKSADKLMPLIQNICTNDNHSSYRKLKVKYEEVEAYMDQFFPEDDALKQFYVRLLEESNSKGVFSKGGATKP